MSSLRRAASAALIAAPLLVASILIGCASTTTQSPDPASPPLTVRPPGKPVVYVASPYSKGDPAINTHFQCRIFDRLMDGGLVWPVVPLWSHFQHTLFPRAYEDWIAYDLALLPRYDACLRLNSEHPDLDYSESRSSGADREVAEFKRMGKPVFYSIEELYAWARKQQP